MKKVIVIGGLNIDFLGLGVETICDKGELSYGGSFKIQTGGKSRSIAQMISCQMNEGEVVMVGKTAKDKYGLYKIPLDSLEESGVDIGNIIIDDTGKESPGVALIPVDKKGNNQIYVLPGINDLFGQEDLQEKEDIFKEVGKNKGILVLSLELPIKTAIYGMKLAKKYGLKTILDPGGLIENQDYSELFNEDIYLVKPNKLEVKILTGVDVVDFDSARDASIKFFSYGIQHVLITVGPDGAYYFSKDIEKHYKIPEVSSNSNVKDETGCGDQSVATLVNYLSKGESMDKAIKKAILSGTLQFYRSGAQPILKSDFKEYLF